MPPPSPHPPTRSRSLMQPPLLRSPTRSLSLTTPLSPSSSPFISSAVCQLQDFNNTGQTHTYLPNRPQRERRRPDHITFTAVEEGEMVIDILTVATFLCATAFIVDIPDGPALACDSPNIAVHFASTKEKKNPDILSFDEAMHDMPNLKNWLFFALMEITQLQDK